MCPGLVRSQRLAHQQSRRAARPQSAEALPVDLVPGPRRINCPPELVLEPQQNSSFEALRQAPEVVFRGECGESLALGEWNGEAGERLG